MKWSTFLAVSLLPLTAQANPVSTGNADVRANAKVVGSATKSVNGNQMNVLTDAAGFTLYTFTRDTAGVSNCRGGCLQEWPPQHVPAGVTVAAPFGTITGNDGETQLTLDGLPLYHYDDDQTVDDAFGEYPSWHVITVR